MKLPVNRPSTSSVRSTSEVRAMAVAVQANLVQLRVAECKRRGIPATEHEIKVSSPGAVRHYREALIDRGVIDGYSDEDLHLRLHEVWGRYCVLCWLFSQDAENPCDFAGFSADREMHCDSAIEVKEAEVHAVLWRMRFELRRRQDAAYAQSAHFAGDLALAETIPAKAFGKTVTECEEADILLSACQHAGMLATLRWILSRGAAWDDPALLQVDDQPF